MHYAVRVLSVGQSMVHGPKIYWMSHWDEMLPLAYNVTLIQGGGITALVNTSPPDDDAQTRLDFPEWKTLQYPPHGFLTRQPTQMIEAALAEVGVGLDEITHVLLTPIELFTTGTLHRFRRAMICMTRRGWVHFHTTHQHPHDSRWRKFPRETLIDLVTDSWDRVRLLDDEDLIAPGLRTWWCGGHHRESMVVEVDTPVGTTAVSDLFFYYDNIESDQLVGICECMEEVLAANARVRRNASHLVPIHDPKVFDRYPGGVIAPVSALRHE